jgi:hypothetical protein
MSSSGERDGREWTLNPPMRMQGGKPAANGPFYVTVEPSPPRVCVAVVPKADLLAADRDLREAREALAELVRLKDIADEWDRPPRALPGPGTIRPDGYREQKAAAWAAARTVLGRLSNPDREETT